MNNDEGPRPGIFEKHASRSSTQMLRLIRAAQPVTRAEIANRLAIDKSTVTENIRPLITAGVLTEELVESKGPGRRSSVVSFSDSGVLFAGANLGVKRMQVGVVSLDGSVSVEDEITTPRSPDKALTAMRKRLVEMISQYSDRKFAMVGISVPGVTDHERKKLIFAPNLGWRNVDIAGALDIGGMPVVVENDATAAAMFEARLKAGDADEGLMSNFILIRSGTGIGVGLVLAGEVYRGGGSTSGVAGEFGHMTIMAGGKPCVCGNRGCWEKYASAASAASLYLGDRPLKKGETAPRFVEIVAKAAGGEIRSRRTLERIGEYLGIGIANMIMGVGIPRVIISGRLVYGWQFIEEPMRQAIGRSIVGSTKGWSVECGEPAGSAIGGAIEVAIDEYLSKLY